jgi:prolyl oligopeptidase
MNRPYGSSSLLLIAMTRKLFKLIQITVSSLVPLIQSNHKRQQVHSVLGFLPQHKFSSSSTYGTRITSKITRIATMVAKDDQDETATTTTTTTHCYEEDDPYIWLEQVESREALNFAQDTNAQCLKALGDPTTSGTGTYHSILNILESRDRIPHVTKYGAIDNNEDDVLYNFWCDSQNPKGIWRKTLYSAYQNDDETTEWTTVLDVDELGKDENVSWVWKGARHLPRARDPLSNNGTLVTRALIFLSRGGADATTIREFDMVEAKFVETDGKLTPYS